MGMLKPIEALMTRILFNLILFTSSWTVQAGFSYSSFHRRPATQQWCTAF